MDGHPYFRWSPAFLHPPVKEGILMNVYAPLWSCTFNHTMKHGFSHNLTADTIFGRIQCPGPYSFSFGSPHVKMRVDHWGKSSAMWSLPDYPYSAVTSTDGISLSLQHKWPKCFYRATVTLGHEPEFQCTAGNSVFRSMIQLSSEFTSTEMQCTFGPFTTSLSYVLDKFDYAAPPIHFLIHFASPAMAANLTLSYFDRWYQRSAVGFQVGNVKFGLRNRADSGLPTKLTDFSIGAQLKMDERQMVAIGYCYGKVMVHARFHIDSHCRFQAGSYLAIEKKQLVPTFFFVFECSTLPDPPAPPPKPKNIEWPQNLSSYWSSFRDWAEPLLKRVRHE
jgi:hypothetical protein